MDVVGDEGNHSWPIELMTDVLSQAMVMVGAEDIQLDVLIVRNIEHPLVVKEVANF